MKRLSRASASAMLLMVLALAFLGVLSIFSLALNQVAQTRRTQGHISGLAVAEAGVEYAIDQLGTNANWTGTTLTLYEGAPLASPIYGTCVVTVIKDGATKWRVTSVGKGLEGFNRTLVTVLEKQTRPLGTAAIMSEGPVTVGGSAWVRTIPIDQHNADIISNTSISQGGSSVVDGTLWSAGPITGAGYWPNEPYSERIPFPDAATIATWKTDWITRAQAGGTITPSNGSITGSSASSTVDITGQTVTITGSKYINGNLNLKSKDKIVLNSNGNHVVYVNGDVELGGQTEIHNNVTLVIKGKLRQVGGTLYKTTPGIRPSPTVVLLGEGYAPSDDVAMLTGGSDTIDWGVVWVLNGSIDLRGNSSFTGAWVVSGIGANARLPSNYTHYYPFYESGVSLTYGVRAKKIVEL
jgi:uncharacterized Zn-binding protein involved in type VI secretion